MTQIKDCLKSKNIKKMLSLIKKRKRYLVKIEDKANISVFLDKEHESGCDSDGCHMHDDGGDKNENIGN
jgi:hypothetical protein